MPDLPPRRVCVLTALLFPCFVSVMWCPDGEMPRRLPPRACILMGPARFNVALGLDVYL